MAWAQMNRRDWIAEFGDIAEALADGNAHIGEYQGLKFAIFDDGDIFPLSDDCRKALNQEAAYYRRHKSARIDNQYSQSSDESVWRYEVGGTID